MDVSKEGALEMGRERFISSMFKLRSIKNMGEIKGTKFLNKMYDEFEGTERQNTSDKPKASVSRVRKR